MGEWQTKDTAPKDGRKFIAYDVIHGFVPWVYWDGEDWISQSIAWSGRFSHWQPLPEPPHG